MSFMRTGKIRLRRTRSDSPTETKKAFFSPHTEGITTKLLMIGFQKIVDEVIYKKLAAGARLIVGG